MNSKHDPDIFTADFLAVDPKDVADAVRELGYFSFESAVKPEFLAMLQRELAANAPRLNHNDVAPVEFNEQYFFPHAFACSQSYFRYVTSDFLRRLCREKFGERFRLKCHRYYETRYGHSMEWHADNVTNTGVVTDIDGLIFILYVNDVFDGEFQLVSDSFKARKAGIWSYNYTNSYIESTFGEQIKSFRMPAGSIILYDTYGIHRAKPIVSSSFTRKSIFFQVDASPANAEKLLINPAFMESRDDALLDYLGFGQPHDFPANPTSHLKHVPLGKLLGYQATMLAAFASRVSYGTTKLVLSHDARMRWTTYRRSWLKRLEANHPRVYRALKRFAGALS